MKDRQSNDVLMLVQVELERNERVGALVEEYTKLTELEKALFRLAAGISEDAMGNVSGHRLWTEKEPSSAIQPSLIQPLAQSLMKTLLDDYPALLTDNDIRNLMNRDYCQRTLGLKLGGFPLLRRREAGRKGSDNDQNDRYYAKLYASKFYVCSQWWKNDHPSNARSLLRFVTKLVEMNPNHPGVPALEHHKRAFQKYVS